MDRNDGGIRIRQCVSEMRETACNIGMKGEYVRLTFIGHSPQAILPAQHYKHSVEATEIRASLHMYGRMERT